jgi:hypothetical protein
MILKYVWIVFVKRAGGWELICDLFFESRKAADEFAKNQPLKIKIKRLERWAP